MSENNFLLRLLRQFDSLKGDVQVGCFLLGIITCVCLSMTTCYVASEFSPKETQPPKNSPAMEALKHSLYRTSNPDQKKYYIEKIIELEEKEAARRRIVVHQVAPVNSQTSTVVEDN